jgi:prepilin-type processing-associated H-X9-DG protein
LLNYTYDGVRNGAWYPDPRWNKSKVSQLVNPGPSGVFTFIDSNPVSGASAGFVMKIRESVGPDAWASRPGEQHNRGASLGFADGHVEHRRWLSTRKELPLGEQPPKPGADQADFDFLRDRLPRP